MIRAATCKAAVSVVSRARFLPVSAGCVGSPARVITGPTAAFAVGATAAICRAKQWNPMTRVVSHREWTRRKVDPAFEMHKFRLDVKAAMEDDMALTEEEQQLVRDLNAGLRDVGSNGWFAKFLVPWWRKWSGVTDPDQLEEGEEVDALEARIVELEEQEGLRLMTNVVGCPAEKVRIGMPVRAVFEQYDDVWFPLFEPAEGA